LQDAFARLLSLPNPGKNWLALGPPDAQEERYRNSCLRADLTQARICIGALLIPLLGFVLNDYSLFGWTRLFYALVAWRFMLVGYTLWLLNFTRRVTSYRSYDRAAFVWGLAVVLSAVGIAATRPVNYLGHGIVATAAMFLFAVVIPNRFLNQIVLSTVLVAGEMVVLAIGPPFPATVTLSLLVAYAVALVTSWHQHVYRWRAFVAVENEQATAEEMRVSEERLRLLGDNLPNSVVYQFTLEPDGTPRFLYVSAGIERLNGVKAEDALKDANALYSQFLPHQLPALFEAGEISARELSVFEREVQMKLPDGRLRWMHLLSCPRRLPDGRVIWDGVQSDITERKRAEEALLRSEKLASVGRMAASIAHEINNPLDAVMNVLFLAKESKELPESTRHLLETADAELKRVAHITRQSLGFYRESNAPTLTSVTAVLNSAVDLLKSKIKAKHAAIERQWDGEVQITAVASELRQVFSNLVANSLDAIDARGMIKLRVSSGQRNVRVTIADNGKGIPPTSRQRIFEPFFTTKGTVGTGLGLWVSQQIIEKHGGKIRVRSRCDGLRRGTTFLIVLPVGN